MYVYLISSGIAEQTAHTSLKSLRIHCKRIGIELSSIPKILQPIVIGNYVIIKLYLITLKR